jgi:hypothetical protein
MGKSKFSDEEPLKRDLWDLFLKTEGLWSLCDLEDAVPPYLAWTLIRGRMRRVCGTPYSLENCGMGRTEMKSLHDDIALVNEALLRALDGLPPDITFYKTGSGFVTANGKSWMFMGKVERESINIVMSIDGISFTDTIKGTTNALKDVKEYTTRKLKESRDGSK